MLVENMDSGGEYNWLDAEGASLIRSLQKSCSSQGMPPHSVVYLLQGLLVR